MHDLKSQRTAFHLVSVVQPLVRNPVTFDLEAPGRGLLRPQDEQRDVQLMDKDRHLESLPDRGHRSDVIEVGMRQPDGPEAGSGGLDCRNQAGSLGTRVDQNGISRPGIPDEVRVGLQRTDGDDFNRGHSGQPEATALRRAVRYFSAAIAAVVASPTAVVTCRVS